MSLLVVYIVLMIAGAFLGKLAGVPCHVLSVPLDGRGDWRPNHGVARATPIGFATSPALAEGVILRDP